MMWFYKLKRAVRVIIAVIAWLPLLVFAGVISGSVGDSGENMETWQALVIVVLLAVGIVFTVFAVLARRRETKAARDAKAVERTTQQQVLPDTNPAAVETKTVKGVADVGVTARIKSGVTLPLHTKAVGVTFGSCQACIQKSKIGDALLIKHNPTDDYPESTDIINARTGGRIGRIKSDLAWELLTAFDEGFTLDGVIADITGGNDGQNHGCNIKITGEHIG